MESNRNAHGVSLFDGTVTYYVGIFWWPVDPVHSDLHFLQYMLWGQSNTVFWLGSLLLAQLATGPLCLQVLDVLSHPYMLIQSDHSHPSQTRTLACEHEGKINT